MTSEKHYQYRMTIGGQVSEILPTLPSGQWAAAAEFCEKRGHVAKLERQLITDEGILPWEILAGVNFLVEDNL